MRMMLINTVFTEACDRPFLTLYDHSVTIATFPMSLISMDSSKLVATYSPIISSTEHQFYSAIQPLALHETTMSIQRSCINIERHCLTNLTHLVYLIKTTKRSFATWPILILSQCEFNMKISRIPKAKYGLGCLFNFCYQYRPF